MHAPDFWKEDGLTARLLQPAALFYGALAARRWRQAALVHAGVPVICIGNLIAGGAGKTPVALAVAELLKDRGAMFLSRGYGGKLAGPVRVDPIRHSAREVGDEPLLLAQALPTFIARDRVAGAKAAVEAGAKLLILDDGFQNPALRKDVSLVVIDGVYGFGNRRLLPAGPLREPVEEGLARAQAIVLVGEDERGILASLPQGLPVLRARLAVDEGVAAKLKGQEVTAFAGIARPRKFYRTLHDLGATVREMVAYPDHHVYSAKDLAALRRTSQMLDAPLVTTMKDYVRLAPADRDGITPVPVRMVFDDSARLIQLLTP